jgi:hypothetical protein
MNGRAKPAGSVENDPTETSAIKFAALQNAVDPVGVSGFLLKVDETLSADRVAPPRQLRSLAGQEHGQTIPSAEARLTSLTDRGTHGDKAWPPVLFMVA